MGVFALELPGLVVAVLIDGHSILHIPVLHHGRALGRVPDGCTVSRHRSRRQITRVNAIQVVVVLLSKRANVPLRTLPRRLSKVPEPVSHLDYIEANLQGERGPLLNGRVRCLTVEIFEGIELVWPWTGSGRAGATRPDSTMSGGCVNRDIRRWGSLRREV